MTVDIELFVSLLMTHQWVAFGAVLIGLAIRLLKVRRVRQRLHISSRYLPLIALLLGQVQAVLESITTNQDPVRAVVQGLIAAAFAVIAHEALVEAILGGRELGRDPEVRGKLKTPLPPPGAGDDGE